MPYMGGIMLLNVTSVDFVHCTLVGRETTMQSKESNQFISMLQLKAGVKE